MTAVATTEASSPRQPITSLLCAWRDGDASALAELTPLIYRELRRLASSRLRSERPGHTLDPTALAHEAFLRLSAGASESWENRSHFFAIASRLMRQILIQHARTRNAEKRGGGAVPVSLDTAESVAISGRAGESLLELDSALNRLAEFDVRKARAVELRFFGGLTTPEIACAMGLSTPTVERDIRAAFAWLRRELAA